MDVSTMPDWLKGGARAKSGEVSRAGWADDEPTGVPSSPQVAPEASGELVQVGPSTWLWDGLTQLEDDCLSQILWEPYPTESLADLLASAAARNRSVISGK